MKPLISVIIPNFNDNRIERTIVSIINQDFKGIELIIVEGCINNKNTNYIYSNYESFITKLIHESDCGIFDALNKGIKVANGEFIFLLGADDKLNNLNVFSSIKREYEIDNDVNGFCIECHFINSKDKIIRKWLPNRITKNKIVWGILPPHFSLFLKKEIYNELGLFDLSKGNIGLDSKWLLKLLYLKRLNIKNLYKHAVIMEIGGISTGSLRNILKAYKNISLEAKNMGLWNWPLIPMVKIISKLPQFRI